MTIVRSSYNYGILQVMFKIVHKLKKSGKYFPDAGVYIITRGVTSPPLKFWMGDFLPQSAKIPGTVRTARKIINRQYTSFGELNSPL